MSKEKCLIIGLGQIGLKYDLNKGKEHILSHSRAIDEHPDFKIIGAVDIIKENRELFKKKYKKPTYTSIKKAIAETRPSVIIISSPSNTHSKILDEIISGPLPKAILCEKPIDSDLIKAKKMVDICLKNNIKLYVNYIRRCDPGSIKVKNKLNKNMIAKPIKGVVWYSKGIKNNGSHFINLLEDWFGKCVSVKKLSDGNYYKNIDDSDYNFLLTFNEAEILFYSSLESSNSYNSIELSSPTGRMIYENGGEEIIWQPVVEDGINNNSTLGKKEILQKNMNQYQYNVMSCISDALRGRISPISTGEDALETLQTIDRVINGDRNEN
tara:strand:- start:1508 stop:2482 length:975 start_codon:yes stop_codon:yes gene_type:complete